MNQLELSIEPDRASLTWISLNTRFNNTKKENNLVQCKHVKVTDVVLLSVADPGPAFLLVDHLAHILVHEGSLSQTPIQRGQTKEHLILFLFNIYLIYLKGTVYCFLAVPELAKSSFVSVVPGQETENKISVKHMKTVVDNISTNRYRHFLFFSFLNLGYKNPITKRRVRESGEKINTSNIQITFNA